MASKRASSGGGGGEGVAGKKAKGEESSFASELASSFSSSSVDDGNWRRPLHARLGDEVRPIFCALRMPPPPFAHAPLPSFLCAYQSASGLSALCYNFVLTFLSPSPPSHGHATHSTLGSCLFSGWTWTCTRASPFPLTQRSARGGPAWWCLAPARAPCPFSACMA